MDILDQQNWILFFRRIRHDDPNIL